MTTKPKHRTKPEKPATAKKFINPAIAAAIITGVVAIIVAGIKLLENPQILSSIFPPPAATLTATPIPFARIESLDVIQDENIIDTINPDETIFLTAGSSVIVRVNIITNTGLEDLVFYWEFCHPEKNKSTKGQAAVEIPYRFSTEGADCIRVKIERGGQYLDNANFLVSTDKSQP